MSWASCLLDTQLLLTLRQSQLFVQPTRFPHAMRDHVQNELNKMVTLGVITPLTDPSDWVYTMVVTTKKNRDEIRFFINPKDLNTAIKRPRYPVRSVDEMSHRWLKQLYSQC